MKNGEVTREALKTVVMYKNRDFIRKLNQIPDNMLDQVLDEEIIKCIEGFGLKAIEGVFRNSSAGIQRKLWSSKRIQQILIYRIDDVNKQVNYYDNVKNIIDFKKIIKSPSVSRNIYESDYFIETIIYGKLNKEFFRLYDVNLVFDKVVSSQMFKELPFKKQMYVIGEINKFSRKLLIPSDFRTRYDSIGLLLFIAHYKNKELSEDELAQLTAYDKLVLDYLNKCLNNNENIKEYLDLKVKNENNDFEIVIQKMRNDTSELNHLIQLYLSYHDYYSVDIETKIFNYILNECEDEIIKEKFLKYLVDNTLKGTNIGELERLTIYNNLKRGFNNKMLSYKDVLSLTMQDRDKDLIAIFYMKFSIVLNNAMYLNGITIEQMTKINVKHINRIVKLLEDNTQDEISAIYGVAIKIYLIYGYERSLEILSGKYGEYTKKFLDNVSKCDVRRVKMREEGSKYIPVIDERFIKFMFDNQQDNHFINMLNDKFSNLYRSWYNLYNNYDYILEQCHNEITLKKVLVILEDTKYDINRNLISPDKYCLNDSEFLENIILGNKTYYSKDEILEEIIKIYDQMQKRIESSIPYVSGVSSDGYKYEVMKFDDRQVFELGYKADCCIRTYDLAHKHLLHAALCRNGRMLIIYNGKNKPVAFCPLKRNGNVLILNSIECIDKNFKITGNYIKDAVSSAVKHIVDVSKNSNEPIKLVCIGRRSYLKPDGVEYPTEDRVPTIYEKNDPIYSKTDEYHTSLDIIYQEPGFKLTEIINKDPEVSYMDPRDNVKCYERTYGGKRDSEAIKVINGINYILDKENYSPINEYQVMMVYYNKDWYIAKTINGIISGCLDTDYRAKEEFDEWVDKINQDILQGNIKVRKKEQV